MRVCAAIALLVLSACESAPSTSSIPTSVPTAPTLEATDSAPVPPARTSFKLSGTVYESTPGGSRPLARVPLDISVEYQSHTPSRATDADGRYEATLPSNLDPVTVKVEYPGYSQPCVARVASAVDTVLDIFVVRDSVAGDGSLPESFPLRPSTVSGVVFEQTDHGKVPVAGARVVADYSGGMGWGPAARTITDGAGRYTLCGLQVQGPPFGVEIFASRQGFAFGSALLVPNAAFVDVELRRQ